MLYIKMRSHLETYSEVNGAKITEIYLVFSVKFCRVFKLMIMTVKRTHITMNRYSAQIFP